MTWNHLPMPNFWHVYTYQGIGLLGSGEAFVFLSGMVTAWVYGRRLITHGQQKTLWFALRRVRLIYLTHLGLFAFYAAVMFAAAPHSQTIFGFPPWKAWLLASVFYLRPTYLGNILAMYCFYIAAAPLALNQMRRGQTWLVILTSAAIWTLGQIPGVFDAGFDLFAWQVLFVAGLIVAFPAVTGGRPMLSRSRFKTVVAACIAVFFVIVGHKHFFHLHLGAGAYTYFTYLSSPVARTNLHPARVLDFAALAYLVWIVPRSLEAKYGHCLPYTALSFLGRHSLQVFAWSTCIAICGFFLQGSWQNLSQFGHTCILLLVTASLFVPAWLHEEISARTRSSKIPVPEPSRSRAVATHNVNV